MMTAPTPGPRLFLLKSIQAGHFKHSGKYYLLNGRWHKLQADKAAPKGAPVAQHPHAAGAPVSGHATLTDSEWDQLKLPAENVNAGTFNKQLEQLKAAANNGDVTGIVASGYGINTYGKKLSVIANHVLELMGSSHKVTPGQKAGEHAAVQTAAEIKDGTLTNEGTKPAEPDHVEGWKQSLLQGQVPTAEQHAAWESMGDAGNSKLGEVMLAAGKKTKQAHQAFLDAKAKYANPIPAPEPLSDKTEPAAEPAPALALPAFEEGKTVSGVAAYYGKIAKQVSDMATAGDIAGLEQMKADGLKPNSKGKVTNTWKGKTANSKTLLAFHDQALAQANGNNQEPVKNAEPEAAPIKKEPRMVLPKSPAPAAAPTSSAAGKLAQIPWDKQLLPDSNTNAKSHNGKVAQIKAMAEAGDIAGLEAFKAGKNTYGVKQTKLAQLALSALKESGPAEAGGMKQTMAAVADQGPAKIATAPAEPSPNEGDTKQGSDGTLVFQNGRWHKQAQPAAQQNAPVDAKAAAAKVQIPKLQSGTGKLKYTKTMKLLKEIAEQEGAEGLGGAVKITPSGHVKIAGYKTINPEGSVYGKNAEAMAQYAKALHQAVVGTNAVGSGAPASPTPKPAAAAHAGVESMDSWQQTGPQGGSNPGGKFKDENGVEWYCKFPGDDDVAKSEVLAAKLYAALGISGQDAKLITKGGKIGIASRWQTVAKAGSPADLSKVDGVHAGFGADAWLGNWDVVGLGYDNLQVGADGKAMRVDAGGSLTYRAQGGKKAFGTTVSEIDSLRDAKINPQAAAVFGNMTQADITASVAKVLKMPDASIKNLVELYGPGDAANKKALADVLIARKADLAAKFPKAAKTVKKRLDPNALPVKDDRLPKAHDFNNWNGPGKGLSSQPHINAANMAVEQELLASAKAGNLTKLKDFKFHAIDKATGNATGQMIPIDQHPSKHVVQLHADLVQILDEIANPPEPLKVFQETDVSTLDQLAATLPSKKFGTTVNAVQSNEKLGFWVVLGTAHGAAKFAPKKVMDYSKDAINAAHDKYKQAKSLAKHFINSVQASGSYNDLFRNGKTVDHNGNKLADVAKAALEHATTMPEGTSLYRWQNMSDEMVKKMLAAPDGTVFQATGPMCTSYDPTATSGFGQHRVVVRYAQGAKAVESFGSGAFKGEKEVTTLPNSRFVILSKKMVPNEKNPSKQRLELEVLMLPPDLGL